MAKTAKRARLQGVVGRFILRPWANAHEGAHWAESYTCDDCGEADYAHAYDGKDITPFYRDTETDDTICETCKAKREANANLERSERSDGTLEDVVGFSSRAGKEKMERIKFEADTFSGIRGLVGVRRREGWKLEEAYCVESRVDPFSDEIVVLSPFYIAIMSKPNAKAETSEGSE